MKLARTLFMCLVFVCGPVLGASAEQLTRTVSVSFDDMPRKKGVSIHKRGEVNGVLFIFTRQTTSSGIDTDYLAVINNLNEQFCSTTVLSTQALAWLTCGRLDGHFDFTRSDKLEVEWVWEQPDDPPAPPPKKKRAVPPPIPTTPKIKA
jgi:hypothetical protein